MRERIYFGLPIVVVTLMCTGLSWAQSPEAEVRAVIDRLFDGMRAGDSTMVRGVFHDGALMQRATENGISSDSPDGFIRAVGTPHDQVWDERIWDVQINVDGPLASAWMEFAFYLGEELRHCGVNSMQFYRGEDGWKIVYLADTSRGLTCDIPPELQP